jgi:hypothetical protein
MKQAFYTFALQKKYQLIDRFVENERSNGLFLIMIITLPTFFLSFTKGLKVVQIIRDKKERFIVLNKTAHQKMLPEFYLNCLKSQLSGWAR